jgi:hypothetical protein
MSAGDDTLENGYKLITTGSLPLALRTLKTGEGISLSTVTSPSDTVGSVVVSASDDLLAYGPRIDILDQRMQTVEGLASSKASQVEVTEIRAEVFAVPPYRAGVRYRIEQLESKADVSVGPQGPQGADGAQGSPGLQGDIGLQGPQGESGLQGIQGGMGLQGLQGTQGIQGLTGDQGVQGQEGPQGIQGIQSDILFVDVIGPKGDRGDTGEKGDTGVEGIQGLKGDQGVQGQEGPQGIQGIQGVQGDMGLQGVQGVQGDVGLQGPQGLRGAAGTNGTNGTNGMNGTNGTFPTAGNLVKLASTEVEAPSIFPGSYSISEPVYSLNSVTGDVYLAYNPYTVLTDPGDGSVSYIPGKFKLYMPFALRNLDENFSGLNQTVSLKADIDYVDDKNNAQAVVTATLRTYVDTKNATQDTSISSLKQVPFRTTMFSTKSYTFVAGVARSLDATGSTFTQVVVSTATTTLSTITISPNEGWFFPNWTGTRACNVQAQINFAYVGGVNDNQVIIWLHDLGTSLVAPIAPIIGATVGGSPSYAVVRNTAGVTNTAQFNVVLPVVGGRYYTMAMLSPTNPVTYSVSGTVSIQAVYG